MARFFARSNSADKAWAEWIAWTLEDASHKTMIQAWDVRPGGRFGLDMDKAMKATDKTIAVLSENYLSADYTQSEWEAAFVDDPRGEQRKLIPVRVKPCSPRGALRSIVYIDLVDLEPEVARETLLDGLRDRTKPDTEPTFPGSPANQQLAPQPDFPNPAVSKPWNVPYERNTFFTGREHKEQGRYSEAEPRSRQSLAIFEKALGAAHLSCETVRNNLQVILAQIEKENGSV